MYHCHEIPFKAFESFDALKVAAEKYPFKGGLCRQLPDEKHLTWRFTPYPVEIYLTTDTCCTADAQFITRQFNARAKVEIGLLPNGAPNCITIWR